MNFTYLVETPKEFEQAVKAVEQKTEEKGFRVLHTHDVGGLLTEKGFPRDPLKIVEVCNARFASQVLQKDINVALMLPCPITVYVEGGKTYISTMRPTAIAQFYPNSGIEHEAEEVEKTILAIIDAAK